MSSNFHNLDANGKDYVTIFCYLFHFGVLLNSLTEEQNIAKQMFFSHLHRFVIAFPKKNSYMEKFSSMIQDLQAEKSDAVTKLTKFLTSDPLLQEHVIHFIKHHKNV